MRKFLLLTAVFLLTTSEGICISSGAKTKEIKLKQGNSYLKVHVRSEEKKIEAKDDLHYYWIKAGEIHVAQGGYEGSLLHGGYTEFFISNQLKEKGKFSNGLKTGEWKKWYENGNLAEISHWKNGKLSGKTKLFDVSGNLISESSYRNNQLHGKTITRDSTGNPQVRKYKNGVEQVEQVKKVKQVEKVEKIKKEIAPMEEKTEGSGRNQAETENAKKKKEKKKKEKTTKEEK